MKTLITNKTVAIFDSIIAVTIHVIISDVFVVSLDKLGIKGLTGLIDVKDGDVFAKFHTNRNKDTSKEFPTCMEITICSNVKYNTIDCVNSMSTAATNLLDSLIATDNAFREIRKTIEHVSDFCHKKEQ